MYLCTPGIIQILNMGIRVYR